MRGITLHEPWGSLIAHGIKHYETRSWGTSWRGPLLIHTARRPVDAAGFYVLRQIARHCYDTAVTSWQNNFPLGKAVAICNLTDCIQMSEEFIGQQTELEIAVGGWQPGRFAWKLKDVRLLEQPIPIKGQQGLWHLSSELEQLVLELARAQMSNEQKTHHQSEVNT